jgi:carbonic anhydrase/acetyltransferase-like protein (isoleucine patch superfamily)
MRAIGDIYLADGVVVTGDVRLSPGVNLWYGTVVRGDVAPITLHERVNLQDGCVVHCDYDRPQVIEAGVVAGHGAVLHGERVGASTLVGIGARLLSGSVVGPGCVIAAGAVVTERSVVPPRSLVMGVPGKAVRQVTDAELERTRAINARYLELARRYARGEIPSPYGPAR